MTNRETPLTPDDIEQAQRQRYLSLDFQYQNAWSEFNTRIAQRQNCISIYTSLTLAAVGAALVPADPKVSYRMLYMVPILSFLFAAMLRLHEGMMDNLHSYMVECEKTDSFLGGYHANPLWDDVTGKVRKLHDIVCSLLIVLSNLVAYVILYSPPRLAFLTRFDKLFADFLILVAIGSAVWVLLFIGGQRHKATK